MSASLQRLPRCGNRRTSIYRVAANLSTPPLPRCVNALCCRALSFRCRVPVGRNQACEPDPPATRCAWSHRRAGGMCGRGDLEGVTGEPLCRVLGEEVGEATDPPLQPLPPLKLPVRPRCRRAYDVGRAAPRHAAHGGEHHLAAAGAPEVLAAREGDGSGRGAGRPPQLHRDPGRVASPVAARGPRRRPARRRRGAPGVAAHHHLGCPPRGEFAGAGAARPPGGGAPSPAPPSRTTWRSSVR